MHASKIGDLPLFATVGALAAVWLAVYLLADHCGLIFYQLARGDLVYWIPGFGVPLSMLMRFGLKVIVDFTGYARSQPTLGSRPHAGS